jgi:5'-deoxynucleotidase YfbR-like HD superfamily hydrolase
MNIRKAYKLRFMKRWQNIFVVTSESVAEHSYYVGLLTMQAHKLYDFDLCRALQMALLHDVAEADLTDCPWDIKYRFPAIATAIHAAELELAQADSDYSELLLEQLAQETLEARIVKLADLQSVVLFCDAELALCPGNEPIVHARKLSSNAIEKLQYALRAHLRTKCHTLTATTNSKSL